LKPFFVTQPNGKLALFSPTLCKFTFCDMTETEALDYGAGRWGDDAHLLIEEALEDHQVVSDERFTATGGRWQLAMTMIAGRWGIDGLQETLALLGLSEAELPQAALDAALHVASR
jgi:hypothetical protein